MVLLAAAAVVTAAIAVGPATAGKYLTKGAARRLFFTKAEVYTKAEAFSKDEVYAKREVYSRGESDGRYLGSTDTAADSDLLDGFDTGTVSGPDRVYVSGGDGDLPANTVDGAAIDDPTRNIFISAQEMDEAFTGGTFPGKTMVGDTPALAFDPTAEETVTFSFRVPDDVVPLSQFEMRIWWSAPVTAGTVIWRLLLSASADEAPPTIFGPVNLSPEAPSTTANGLDSIDLIFSGFAQPGSLATLTLSRNAGHGSDLLAGDAHLHAVRIGFVEEQ